MDVAVSKRFPLPIPLVLPTSPQKEILGCYSKSSSVLTVQVLNCGSFLSNFWIFMGTIGLLTGFFFFFCGFNAFISLTFALKSV